MRMRHIRKLHRAACWLPPMHDDKGHVTKLGHHRVPLRAWLRAQHHLHRELTGKALVIAVGGTP